MAVTLNWAGLRSQPYGSKVRVEIPFAASLTPLELRYVEKVLKEWGSETRGQEFQQIELGTGKLVVKDLEPDANSIGFREYFNSAMEAVNRGIALYREREQQTNAQQQQREKELREAASRLGDELRRPGS